MTQHFTVGRSVPGLVAVMQRMYTQGSDANFAIFDADEQKNYFAQMVLFPGAAEVYAEVVGDDNANPPQGYDSVQKARLAARHWQPQRGNLVKRWTIVGESDFEGIAHELSYVFTEVFRCPPDRVVRVNVNIE